MKYARTRYTFWIFQLLGWGAFSLLSAYVSKYAKTTGGFVIHFLGILAVGVIATTLLRYYLKRFVSLNSFSIWDFLKTLLGVSVTVFLFPKLSYGVGYLTGRIAKWFYEDTSKVFNELPKNTDSNYFGIAIIIVGWTLLYFIITLIRRYNASRIQRLQLKDKVKQAQLNTLKGHINPNFIFTTLNKIKGLMLEDVPKSRSMLTKLSEMLRYSLTKNNINSVSLEEELEVVENYIDLLGIEYSERLLVSYDVAPEALKQDIPPMILLSLLEMATKHGVLQSQKGGNVNLVVTVTKDLVQLQVTHDGKVSGKKESLVLRNTVKQRLHLLYKGTASFSSKHPPDKTILLVELPILNPIEV